MSNPAPTGSPSLPRPAASRKSFLAAWRLFLVAGLVLFLDLLTKAWVQRAIPFDTYTPPWRSLIDGWLYLVHIGNEGAAFGALKGFGYLLALFALVALAAIYRYRNLLELYRPGVQIIFGLIIGGILGNFIDRVWHGHVIDFIDVRLPFPLPGIGSRWPAFNIADSGITVGVLLYALYVTFFSPSLAPPPTPAAPDPAQPAPPPESGRP